MTVATDKAFHQVELELTAELSKFAPGVNYIAATTSNDARFKSEKCLVCAQRVATGDATVSNDKVPGWIHTSCMRVMVKLLDGASAQNSRQEWKAHADAVERVSERDKIAREGYFGFLDEEEALRQKVGGNRKRNGRVTAMNNSINVITNKGAK